MFFFPTPVEISDSFRFYMSLNVHVHVLPEVCMNVFMCLLVSPNVAYLKFEESIKSISFDFRRISLKNLAFFEKNEEHLYVSVKKTHTFQVRIVYVWIYQSGAAFWRCAPWHCTTIKCTNDSDFYPVHTPSSSSTRFHKFSNYFSNTTMIFIDCSLKNSWLLWSSWNGSM